MSPPVDVAPDADANANCYSDSTTYAYSNLAETPTAR
jgi:hypothetical protein